MSLESEAAALVAAVNPADVAALLATFPKAEDIRVRANWHTLDPHLGERVPKAPADRRGYLKRKIAQYEQALERDIARHNLLRENGLAVLSPYDICISSSRNPLGALACALRLKDAHISYDLSILVKLSLELEDVETVLAEAAPPQLALF